MHTVERPKGPTEEGQNPKVEHAAAPGTAEVAGSDDSVTAGPGSIEGC